MRLLFHDRLACRRESHLDEVGAGGVEAYASGGAGGGVVQEQPAVDAVDAYLFAGVASDGQRAAVDGEGPVRRGEHLGDGHRLEAGCVGDVAGDDDAAWVVGRAVVPTGEAVPFDGEGSDFALGAGRHDGVADADAARAGAYGEPEEGGVDGVAEGEGVGDEDRVAEGDGVGVEDGESDGVVDGDGVGVDDGQADGVVEGDGVGADGEEEGGEGGVAGEGDGAGIGGVAVVPASEEEAVGGERLDGDVGAGEMATAAGYGAACAAVDGDGEVGVASDGDDGADGVPVLGGKVVVVGRARHLDGDAVGEAGEGGGVDDGRGGAVDCQCGQRGAVGEGCGAQCVE